MHDCERPDEEHAGLIGGVRDDYERSDVVVHLALCRHPSTDHLRRYGRANDVTVVPHVADTELQAEFLVALADHSILAENYRLSPEKKLT